MTCEMHRWKIVRTLELQSEAGFETIFECRDCSAVWTRRVNQTAVLLHKSLLVPEGTSFDMEALAKSGKIFTIPKHMIQNPVKPRFHITALELPHKEPVDLSVRHKPTVTCPCDECVLTGMELDEQLAAYKLT